MKCPVCRLHHPPPISNERLAQVRAEAGAFPTVPASDVKRLLARLDRAEGRDYRRCSTRPGTGAAIEGAQPLTRTQP